MSKVAVIYWSGTGNTQAMAEAVNDFVSRCEMTVTSDSVWTALPAIDSLYLQRIGKVPDNAPDLDARKTEIGRARKAWQLYVEQLHRLSAAVPEACRERFLRIVADQTDKYLTTLQK